MEYADAIARARALIAAKRQPRRVYDALCEAVAAEAGINANTLNRHVTKTLAASVPMPSVRRPEMLADRIRDEVARTS